RAAEILLRRVWPERKGRPMGLPPLRDAADLLPLVAATLQAVAAGDLAAGEARDIGRLLAVAGRAIETEDLAARIAALEGRLAPALEDEG
ncbi:hypothetical protein ACX4MT_20110, partial [Roseomonas mucosa]